MEERNSAFYPLQTIRKIGNIPVELFGMKMSEITLLIQIIGLSYVVGIILQVVANGLFENPPTIMYYPVMIIPLLIMQVIKYINKTKGKGLIFFIVASFKAKDKLKKQNKTVLETKEL